MATSNLFSWTMTRWNKLEQLPASHTRFYIRRARFSTMNIWYRIEEIQLPMKLFDKIKEKMCMSKTSAVLGFRVTLRSFFLYFQILWSSLFIILPFMIVGTNVQVWSNPKEGYMLHIPGGTEAKDCNKVSQLLTHPSTFHRWWHRGDRRL